MARLDAARGAVDLSIVFVGPHGPTLTAAATTLHAALPAPKTEPISLSMGGDRVVVFECTPKDTGSLNGLTVSTRISAVIASGTRAPTSQEQLQQADAVVLVLRALPEARLENEAAVQQLFEELTLRGPSARDVPLLVQLEQATSPDAPSVEELLLTLGLSGVPYSHSNLKNGQGALEAFQAVYSLLAQRVLDSEELRSSSVAILVRERNLSSKLNGIEQSVLGIAERMNLLTENLLVVSETLMALKQEGAARDNDLRSLRRVLDEQASATRKLIQQSQETSSQRLLSDLQGELQQMDSAGRERLAALDGLVRQSTGGLNAELQTATSAIQKELAALHEGVEDLRSDSRQKRKGFWRSVGT